MDIVSSTNATSVFLLIAKSTFIRRKSNLNYLFISYAALFSHLFHAAHCPPSAKPTLFKRHCRSGAIRSAPPKNRSTHRWHIASIPATCRWGRCAVVAVPRRGAAFVMCLTYVRFEGPLGTRRGGGGGTITSPKSRVSLREMRREKSSDVNFRDERVRSWEITVLRLSCLFGNLYLSSLCQHHAEMLGRVSR